MNANFLWNDQPPFDNTIPDEEKWRKIRVYRNKLLADCDWTQVADSPLPAEKKAEWAVYRSALRDLPQAPGDPEEVQLPIPPA